MTRFNSDDHTTALRACFDATDFGAAVTDHDLVILNRAAGSFACNEPETLTRREFAASLGNVQEAVRAARLADPDRAACVLAERDAKAAEAYASRHQAQQPRKPGNKADRKVVERLTRYNNDPIYRAQCDKFGNAPGAK